MASVLAFSVMSMQGNTVWDIIGDLSPIQDFCFALQG